MIQILLCWAVLIVVLSVVFTLVMNAVEPRNNQDK